MCICKKIPAKKVIKQQLIFQVQLHTFITVLSHRKENMLYFIAIQKYQLYEPNILLNITWGPCVVLVDRTRLIRTSQSGQSQYGAGVKVRFEKMHTRLPYQNETTFSP